MRTSFRLLSIAAAVWAVCGASVAQTAAPAAPAAAEAKPPYTLTGNVGFVNEYRYRGIAQTNKNPALQGGFDFAHESGAYLGVWGSNVSWLPDAGISGVSNSLETDVYGGYKGTVDDFGYDVGGLLYVYPGSYPGSYVDKGIKQPYFRPQTFELYAAGTYKMFTLKYSRSMTNLFGYGDSKGSGYLDLTGTFEIGEGMNLIAHVGRQTVENNAQFSYTDYKLGVTKDFAGFAWGLSYIDTSTKAYTNVFNKDLGKGNVVVSVGKTF